MAKVSGIKYNEKYKKNNVKTKRGHNKQWEIQWYNQRNTYIKSKAKTQTAPSKNNKPSYKTKVTYISNISSKTQSKNFSPEKPEKSNQKKKTEAPIGQSRKYISAPKGKMKDKVVLSNYTQPDSIDTP